MKSLPTLPFLNHFHLSNGAIYLTFAVLLGSSSMADGQPPTAAAAWKKIQHRYAKVPPPDTVDTLKVGDSSTPVTGIATTFLDTMDVLREAVRRGDNLIITHEPTFYNHRDDAKDFVNDPVYKEKVAYIEQHHLVVYRLHDEIHDDPGGDHILKGVYRALGWDKLPHPPGVGNEYIVTIPTVTLGELAKELKERLHAQTMRVEGDAGLAVSRVAVVPGAAGLQDQVLALNQPGVDLLIAGEAREWETVEYVRDAIALGRHKALILLGHEVSEEPGMEQCAIELRVLFPGVRVDHIAAGQPLWNPDHPPCPK